MRTVIDINGKEYASHNIYHLLHLEDAEYFGILENYSAFSFENYMQSLLKMM